MKKHTLLSLLLVPLLMSATADTITLNFQNIDRLDSRRGDPGWDPVGGDNALIVGESSEDDSHVFMVALNFDLAGQAAAIQNAPEIIFSIDYTWVSSGIDVELQGFGRSNAVLSADYATTAAVSAGTIPGSSLTLGGGANDTEVLGTLSYDVTAILKDLVANNWDYAGFRLVAPQKMSNTNTNDAGYPLSDGSGDVVGFYRTSNRPADVATLTIIPEPGTLVLLGLAGLAMVVFRRGHRKT